MNKTLLKLAVLTDILAIVLAALTGCGNPWAWGGRHFPAPSPAPPDFDLWDGTIAGGFAGGDGIKTKPYIIRTGAQLAYLAWTVNNDGADYEDEYFTLESDLDLDDREWEAIGTDAHRFKGNFDGNHHVISRLSINKSDTDYQGLFGYLDGAVIHNLGLEDVAIQGGAYVGGIAGRLEGNSSITGSYSTGAVRGTGYYTGNYTGGIAGYVDGSSIDNSYSTGAVSGTGYFIGGIAGYVSTGGSIDNSYSTGAVSGISWVGGIAGYVEGSSIDNSYSTGPVSGTGGSIGGIAGILDNSSISGSYSTGAVSGGNDSVGGIAGSVNSGSSIDNSYSTGPVGGTSQVGGIAGSVSGGSIDSSYSTGTVNGTGNYTGGIAGYVYDSSISGSYSTGAVSGNTEVGGIAGRLNNSSIYESYSTGTVDGTSHNVGGIAGVLNNSSIYNSYSTGAVGGGGSYTGGIAGYVSANDRIENCAALNPSVTATSNYAGRVTGYVSGITFAGNVAWDGMAPGAGGVPFVTANTNYTGTGISKGAVQNGSGLPASLKTNPPWIYEEGKLPVLDDLADGTLPDHLALVP
jgi:hypothetical protein